MEPDGSQPQDLIPWVIEQLGESHVLDLLWDSAVWGVLGATAGLAIGLVVFFALRALGGYRWEWRHAVWFRGLTALLTVAVSVTSFGSIGLLQGALKGSETVLRESQLATGEKGFPVIGHAGADFLAYVYLAAPIAAAGKDDAVPEDRFDAWQAGQWELDVAELFHRTESLTDSVARQGTSRLKASVLTRFPQWKGGRMEWFLDNGLHALGKVLLKRSIDGKLKEAGPLGKVAKKLVDRLPDEAERSGDPQTISRDELSEYFVQEGIVPVILVPLRSFVRGQQLTVMLMAWGGFLLPVACFRLADWVRARRAAKAAATAGPATDEAADGDPKAEAADEAKTDEADEDPATDKSD